MVSARPPMRNYGFLRPARGGRCHVFLVVREAVLEAREHHYAPDVAVLERVAEAALRELANIVFTESMWLRLECRSGSDLTVKEDS
jgi:hypothetical protein